MSSDNLYIISAILGIALLSLAVRSLLRYGWNLLGGAERSANETVPASASTVRLEQDNPENALTQDFTITFCESDKAFPWDSDKACLLDFIEAKGIDVESLCGAGECGSCRTRLVEGEVEYLQEPKVAPGKGYCLLCVTVPKTDLVLAR